MIKTYKRKSNINLVPYIYIVVDKVEEGYRIVEIHSRPLINNIIKLIKEEQYIELEETNIIVNEKELESYSLIDLYKKYFQVSNLLKYFMRTKEVPLSQELETSKLLTTIEKLILEKDGSNI